MISFALTDEQNQVRDTLTAFAENELAPRARSADEARGAPTELLDTAWSLGFTGLSIPEGCGGGGAPRSHLTGALMLEALGYGCAGLAGAALSSMLFVNPLIDLGSEEQKLRYLPAFCGETRCAASLALHEAASGVDLAGIATRAERCGTGWIITGTKRLVPMGEGANHLLVLARASDARGLAGIRAFIVGTDAAGVTIAPERGTIGLTALGFVRVELAGVRLEGDAVLGGGDGADIRPLLASLRIGGAALATGLARAVTDFAIPYAKQRVAFGEPIARKQSIAFMLADMHIECDAMRWMVWKAAAEADAGRDATRASVLARNYVNRHAFKIADDGLQIFGGHGYIRDLPLEMWLRNMRMLTIHDAIAAA
ncbi:acyl-CoA dehydrogenase family protein [Bradyrhizobium sp. Arg68]|uniref:acyl-CoA dehydrogenase family protein n=1 Tax=Bradyrhizobium ivorense TaxID=2511166 RepID=UPI001E60F5C1|nr:acyl-CoA dehydrogenase family protein [Bradyrhizobium ivorense]MCC8934968.1 acyl-CoA dehydrogenase family protein [Bradyrhizobium ivorense]